MLLSNSRFNGLDTAAGGLQRPAVSGIGDVYRQLQIISAWRGGCGVDGRYQRGRAGMRGDQRGGGDRGGRMDAPATTEPAGSIPQLRVARRAGSAAPHNHPGLHHADARHVLDESACHHRPMAGVPGVGAAALPAAAATTFAIRRKEATEENEVRAIEEWGGVRAVHEYCDALFARRTPARAQPRVVVIYVDRMTSPPLRAGRRGADGFGYRAAARPQSAFTGRTARHGTRSSRSWRAARGW